MSSAANLLSGLRADSGFFWLFKKQKSTAANQTGYVYSVSKSPLVLYYVKKKANWKITKRFNKNWNNNKTL